MTKVPIIKFMFRSDWKVLTDALHSATAYESESFESSNDLITLFLSGTNFGVVLASLKTKNDLIQLATLVKTLKKSAPGNFIKIIVINFAGNKQFEKAVAKLKAAAVPTDGMVCVLHPEIAYDLKAALTTSGNTPFAMGGVYGDVGNEAMRMGYVGMLAGIPIYETSNIAAVTNPGDFAGAVFHRDALGLGLIGDISIETQRRAAFLGDDIVCSAYYGVGELQDAYGRHLKFDSSLT